MCTINSSAKDLEQSLVENTMPIQFFEDETKPTNEIVMNLYLYLFKRSENNHRKRNKQNL